MSLLPGAPASSSTSLTTTVQNLFPTMPTTMASTMLSTPALFPEHHHTSYLSIPHFYPTNLPKFDVNASLWKLHNERTLQVEPTDMDVASITETTRDVRISEVEEEEDDDKPLDLSMRNVSPSPSTSSVTIIHSPSPSYSVETDRPSVIIEASSSGPSVRRSSSSVGIPSSTASVQEHFRRSLSGKWPRRQRTEEEKARSSPFSKRASFREHKIIEHSTPSIEEHFRKALDPDAFNKWKQKQTSS
ncbi:unnamed protein product, partial [Mesorhabditis spiculigera]